MPDLPRVIKLHNLHLGGTVIGCVKSKLVTMFSKVCCWIVRVVEGFFEFCKSGSSCSEELPGGSGESQENGRI